jgi:hypothetical protein
MGPVAAAGAAGVSKWLGRFWPPLILLLLLLAVFGGYLLDGRVLAIGDGIAQDFPLRILAAQAWRQGIVPFWDPFAFAGLPLLGAIQIGAFFPGNWTFLVLPPVAAMNTTELLAFWSAGVGAYALARAQSLSRLSAFGAGLVFMGSGFMVAHIDNLPMLQAAALLPAVLWAIARHHQTGGTRYARIAAVLLALQILAGHPQMVLFGSLVVVAYAVYLALITPAGKRTAFASPLVAAGALALGLCALQLLPTLDFIPLTQRASIDYEKLVYRSLPPRQLISFWLPYLFGGYVTPFVPVTYWGGPHQTDLGCYAGLATWVLAALALFMSKGQSAVKFWWGVALVGAVLALGRFTPLYNLIAVTPLLHSLPAPGRHLLETDLALALLAAFGLEALRIGVSPGRVLWAWGLSGLPLVGVAVEMLWHGPAIEAKLQPFMPAYIVLTGWFSLSRPVFWVPLALWIFAGLVLVAASTSTAGQRTRDLARMALLASLVFDLGLFTLNQGWVRRAPRLPNPLVLPAPALLEQDARVWQASSVYVYPYDDFASVRALHYPNWGNLVGVRSVTGYDAFVPKRYARVMGEMESTGLMAGEEVWDPAHHGLDLLGVRTLVLDPVVAADPLMRFKVAQKGFLPVTEEPGAVYFRNARALPRAWRVAETASSSPLEVERHVCADLTFNPAQVGYLDAPDAAPGKWSPGVVEVSAPNFNTLRFGTVGEGAGFIAVSESYDPGWRAFLALPQGELEVPVHCLDAIILGVAVPAGVQHVTLRYEPRTWRLGLVVSTLALVILLLWGWRDRRRAVL